MRICKNCKIEYDITNFYEFKRGLKVYRRHLCKKCYNERAKPYRLKFHKKHVPYSRAKALKRHFNITLNDYDEMFRLQNGKCDICKSETSLTKRSCHFLVDHCHKTGKIRGLLCYLCNSLLGFAKDNPETLNSARDYLFKHK